MKPVEIANLLDKLTDQLVLTGEVHNVVIDNPGLWVRLLSATQKTLNSFGCAWSFKISAGPVDASLKACKPT